MLDPRADERRALELLTPSAYWLPDHIVESAWTQHAPFAFWVMDVHRPRVFVELGTHRGFSYLAFCQAATRLDTDTRCYAIDHWEGDEHAGYYDNSVYQQLAQIHDPRYGSFSELVRSTFREAARHFEDGSVDLLHIDGAHRVEHVVDDYECWLPKLSARGIILFHDINVHRDDFGVFAVWEGLKSSFPHFEFDHGHGLGVLGVGSQSEETLGQLFELSSNPVAAAAMRRVFARLGGGVSDFAVATHATAIEESCRQLAESLAAAGSSLREAETRATEAETRATEAETRATEAETRATEAETRATEAETRATEAETRATEADLNLASTLTTAESLESALLKESEATLRLAAEVTALRTSTSWRVTSPFRGTSRLIRWLARQVRRAARIVWWTVTLQLPSRLRARQSFRHPPTEGGGTPS